jgi:hypothetical protein
MLSMRIETRILLALVVSALGVTELAQGQTNGSGPGNANPIFQYAVGYNTGAYGGYAVAVGDFNGDGKLDAAAANDCPLQGCANGVVSIFLGNGDGTFQPAVQYSSGALYALSVAVADVNKDGKADLLVGNSCGSSDCSVSGGVGVLLGNGDGTFQTAVPYNSIANVYAIAAGDLNNDGDPDVVLGSGDGTVVVLLGNGDGTFQAPVSYASGGFSVYGVAVADVNADGKPDLLTANYCDTEITCSASGSGIIGVLKGNGDGTFQAAAAYDSGGSAALSVAAADLNADGKIDLVVANQNPTVPDGSVGVLSGNGDGTFQTAVAYDSGGSSTRWVVVGDVTGDGVSDVLVADQVAGWCSGGATCSLYSTVALLQGNGDGTFQAAVAYGAAGWGSQSLAVADINGDGFSDVIVANDQLAYGVTGGGIGVLVGYGNSASTTSTSMNSSAAEKIGNRRARVALSRVGGARTGNSSTVGQTITLLATVASGSGTPDGSVSFNDGSQTLATVPLTNGSAQWSTSSLAVGQHIILAAYSGNVGLKWSTSQSLAQTITQAATTTVVSAPGNLVGVGQSVTYTAVVTSTYGTVTGTVSFKDGTKTVTSTISGGQATYTTSYTTKGTHTITATYSGDVNNLTSNGSWTEYVEMLPVKTTTTITSSLNPSLINQSVTFTAAVTSTYGAIPDGELVTFKDGATQIGTGTTAGGMAAFTTSALSAKTHTIKAVYAGDATFKTSTGTVKQTVSLYSTTTALTSTPNPSDVGQAVTFTATVTTTAPTGLATGKVTFKDGTTSIGTATLDANGVATLNKSTLAVGFHSITATYNGDSLSGKSTSSVLVQEVD